jgi:hypothetical protein
MILPPEDARPCSPQDPFALAVLARLPLTEAFYAVWGYLASDDVLDRLFDQHRGRCYQDKLSFAELVAVLADAVTRYHGSGRRAIHKALDHQGLSTQARAVYTKLSRLPLPLAEAFLSGLTARLRPLFPAGPGRDALPPCLAGLAVVVLDGKKIKNAAKRLLPTRGRPGRLYGGKVLAAYLPADGLVVALAADADGEANDIRLVPRVLPLARQAVAGARLWVADSQFCDLDQAARFTAEGDHFLVRFTRRNGFAADPARPARAGRNASGQAFTQEWGWMGAARDARRRYARRITLERPGEEAVAVVTDLLDEAAYPAEELLAAYLTRWQIENVFQQITEVFELRTLIGSAPAATVFQASLCLVLYNVLQVIRSHAAQAGPEPTPPAALSAEQIFKDLHEELIGLHRTLRVEEALGVLPGPAAAAAVRCRLGLLLGRAWTARWRKAANAKRRPAQAKAKQSGAHTSVHKLLQQAQQQRQKATPPRRQ